MELFGSVNCEGTWNKTRAMELNCPTKKKSVAAGHERKYFAEYIFLSDSYRANDIVAGSIPYPSKHLS